MECSKFTDLIIILAFIQLYVIGIQCGIPKDTFASSTTALIKLLNDEETILDTIHDTLARSRGDTLNTEFRRILQSSARLISLKPNHLTPEYLEDFYGHPINAYHAIHAWASVSNFMEKEANYQAVIDVQAMLKKNSYLIPTNIDHQGMIHCILRLQDVYDLSTSQLFQGIVQEFQSAEPLSVHDCYLIGHQAYLSASYTHARQWLQLAQSSDQQAYAALQPNERKDLHYFLYSINKNEGFLQEAESEIEKAHISSPVDTFISQEMKTFKFQKFGNSVVQNTLPVANTDSDSDEKIMMASYKKLCQGIIVRNNKRRNRSANEFCRYTGTYPYAKYKQEIFNTSPWVSFFHDAILDDDIKCIKNLSLSMLDRSTVESDQNLFLIRTSSTAWLSDTLSTRIRDLSLKVQSMTGLNIRTWGTEFLYNNSTAEFFQVLNYGFGGHYTPHMDTLKNSYDKRVATFMFYLTNVRAGGATVFTKLGIRIPAKKGRAAFWFNINKAGDIQEETQHAGCPVLVGHKWVANKWIRYNGQLFARPCGPSANSEEDYIL